LIARLVTIRIGLPVISGKSSAAEAQVSPSGTTATNTAA
jgi:hypothetical protein